MTERDSGASTCRCCDEQAVAKVLYTYAERIDAGDFEGVGDLFADAVITFVGTRHGRCTNSSRGAIPTTALLILGT
jgi:hypothetical protein